MIRTQINRLISGVNPKCSIDEDGCPSETDAD